MPEQPMIGQVLTRQKRSPPSDGLGVPTEKARNQLDRILSSRIFSSSARMCRFLRFTVEETLAGHAEDLKEITIGLAVFDRLPDYDPRLDPIVRVEARRLREKLSQFYELYGREDPIVIELPRGTYVPTILERAAPSPPAPPDEVETNDKTTPLAEIAVATLPSAYGRWRRISIVAPTLAVLVLLIAAFTFRSRIKLGSIRERDSVVLSDFLNRTGEPVFDLTLRQALAAQLSQSPFLTIIPDERVRSTLRVMGRSPDNPPDQDVALEVCRRQRAKALLGGSISKMGNAYVLTLEATNCGTGEAITNQQMQVDTKESVLGTVGRMASRMRGLLGESLASIQQFDAPVEQTTTPSLDALRAFALGQRQRALGNEIESLAFFQRAIEIDPNFASAYNSLSNTNSNLGEAERANEFAKLAFERRNQVSERERLYIDYQYHDSVTGNQPQAIQILELWKQLFPREFQPVNSLAFIHVYLGNFERAVSEGHEAIARNPAHGFPYSNLAVAYRALGKYDDARRTAERAVALNVETVPTRILLHQLALLSGDVAAAQLHLQQVKDAPRDFQTIGVRAEVAAWSGKLNEARRLYEETVRLAERRSLPEVATGYIARISWMESAFGNSEKAAAQARRVLARKPSYDHQLAAAMALASTGSVREAETITSELSRSHPQHTIINSILAPSVKAAVELHLKRPEQAIEHLGVTTPYETGLGAALIPIYLRGQAYLMQRCGAEAAEQFKRILSHRGIDPFSTVQPLALVGLARGLAMVGEVPKSRETYEQFFSNWSSADPDIPLLQTARKEYETLKAR